MPEVAVRPRHVSSLPIEQCITKPMLPDEKVGDKSAAEYLCEETLRMLNNGAHVELLENGGGRLAICKW